MRGLCCLSKNIEPFQGELLTRFKKKEKRVSYQERGGEREREREREGERLIRYRYTIMNHRPIEDHMMLISQLYPAGAYTQIIAQQG